MKIKYFLIVIISVVLISSLSAQDNDTKKSSKKGLIKGFVFDNDSGLPLEAATVRLLFDVDTSLVGGTQTDKTGAFAVEAPYGKFRLVVDFIGYKTFVKRKIAVTPKKLEINLDTIFLAAGFTTENIEVEDEKPFMQNEIDKKVYMLRKA